MLLILLHAMVLLISLRGTQSATWNFRVSNRYNDNEHRIVVARAEP